MCWLLISLFIASPTFAEDTPTDCNTLHASKSESLQQNIERISAGLLGTPYTNAPLGEGAEGLISQKPLYDFQHFDCTTYIETVLALAHSRNCSSFEKNIKRIRYANGKVDYLTRNHLVELDWIPNNQKAGFLHDITAEIAPTLTQKISRAINRGAWLRFRSQHWQAEGEIPEEKRPALEKFIQKEAKKYPPLAIIIAYIPSKELLNPDLSAKIPSGTIFNVVRDDVNWVAKDGERRYFTGTLISHQGFIIQKKGKTYIRHAAKMTLEPGKVRDELFENYVRRFMLPYPSILGLNFQAVLPAN